MPTGHHCHPAGLWPYRSPLASSICDDETLLISHFNYNVFNNQWDNDTLALGNIRIPVCLAKEVTVLATDDLDHGITDGNKMSFLHLWHQSKRYDSDCHVVVAFAGQVTGSLHLLQCQESLFAVPLITEASIIR